MRRKLRFVSASLLSTLADFVVLALMVRLVEMGVLGATLCAATIGATTNYFINRHHVFGATGQRKREQMPRYFLVAGSTMLFSSFGTAALAEWVGLHYLLARAIAAIVVLVCFHYPLARLVFREKPKPSRDRNAVYTNTGGVLMKPELSIIVPAYNESQRLPNTLNDMQLVLQERAFSAEVIVVDDGSSDGTAERVRGLVAGMPQLRVIECEENRGKGEAVRTGVLAARGEVVLFMDADNSVSLDQVDLLLQSIQAGADAAIGSRYLERSDMARPQPWYRVAWSRLANWFVQRALLRGVIDTQCGFKAFRAEPARRAFEQLTISGWGFDLEVLTLLQEMGYQTVEVPVTFIDDPRSRIDPLADAWGVARDFVQVKLNLLRGRYDVAPRPLEASGEA